MLNTGSQRTSISARAPLPAGVDLGQPPVPARVRFRETLLQLRIEAREVQLVQLAQVGPVRGVHGVTLGLSA